MKRSRVLQLLTQAKPELVSRFGVTYLALFGSKVRDQARFEQGGLNYDATDSTES